MLASVVFFYAFRRTPRVVYLPTMKRLPRSWRGLLWWAPLDQLDIRRDRAAIIHHVLAFGTLRDIRTLRRFYAPDEIRRVFARTPLQVYSAPAFYFVKDILLNLRRSRLNASRYTKRVLP